MNQTLRYEDSWRNCQVWERSSRSNAVAIDRFGHTATSTQKRVTPIDLYLRHAHFSYRQALTCLKSCPKNGDVPKSLFLPIGSHGAIGRHIFKYRPWF